ncbi:MAG: DNA-directed RNA polymerase subunit alpha [Candidatus Kerfeldbacteria bacterium]|nr:DNA-directed RNA polymerase subunit alpha [Candidatus Kerfeldbacteria bacterium]
MENISLPSTIQSTPIAGELNKVQISVSPCYPGYGTTLGNAMRRVLLSSLPGVAVTAIKIKGVDHEFSTIDHVKEDVVEIILNMKALRFRLHSEEPVELVLEVKGEKVVTAGDFESNAQVEIVNPDAMIATLTDKAAEFHMKAIIQPGRGYVPVESREHENIEVGYIAIDSIYSPVRNVNFRTEHVRVGQMTNYDKLLLDVSTDGTMSPEEAFRSAANILVEQFQALSASTFELPSEETAIAESETADEETDGEGTAEPTETTEE